MKVLVSKTALVVHGDDAQDLHLALVQSLYILFNLTKCSTYTGSHQFDYWKRCSQDAKTIVYKPRQSSFLFTYRKHAPRLRSAAYHDYS